MKIKADATELNEQMERSAKILADAVKKSQVSIEDVGKAFAKMSAIDYNIPIPSFSSHTSNNSDYWKELQKEMNQMNYENLKRDNTVYHCTIIGTGSTCLFRFIDGDRKQIINCHTGYRFNDSDALHDNMLNMYRLANLKEQCRFYNEFGYKDAKGRVWKAGDSDSEGGKIEKFEIGYDGKKVWTKSRHDSVRRSWRQTCWLDKYEGRFPVEKSFIESMQEPIDILREAVETSQMSINQCRESLNLTKPKKVHWLKRFIRKLV